MKRGSMDGAKAEHIELYGASSLVDFISPKRLDSECCYTWRSLLSGGFFRCAREGKLEWAG